MNVRQTLRDGVVAQCFIWNFAGFGLANEANPADDGLTMIYDLR